MSCLFPIFYFDNNMTEKMIKDLISQWNLCQNKSHFVSQFLIFSFLFISKKMFV